MIADNSNDCDYGLLNNGIATWGTDSNGKRITSPIIARNASASINAFTYLYNLPDVLQIWFQSLDPHVTSSPTWSPTSSPI